MKAGVGSVVITPEEPMWMAGYASRNKPSEGKIHDLRAKALVIEDENGKQIVLVTADILGFPREVSSKIAGLVEKRFGIPRERLALCASHTHTGPVVRDNLIGMYDLTAEEAEKVRRYTENLPGKILQAVEAAFQNMEPCRLYYGVGYAGFAMNRRKYTIHGVINDRNPIGPVDRDVPVLKILREDGSPTAVVFGYACHATTLSFYKFTGDYPGFAQYEIERELPGATALFIAGCGGDANPLPRGTLSHARSYGKSLATAVTTVLRGSMEEVRGPIHAVYEEIPLQLTKPPTRQELEKELQDPNQYIRRRAQRLLEQWDEKGGLETTYPYPIQIWQFGNDLRMVLLGGEVVADYSLLLKYLYGRENLWVAAYANDVMAYIPSLRVLYEGGYEGDTSMIYYGFYGKWAPEIEETILAAVDRLATKASE